MLDIIPPIDKRLLVGELKREFLLRPTNKANNEIYDITAHECPNVMREVARLRELSYRQAGGSKGEALDMDDMDTMVKPYHQLIVWNPDEQEIVGGYRYLPLSDCTFTNAGQPYITSSFLFIYSELFIKDYLASTIELGRAFVQPKYQTREAGLKALFALDNLWDGLGAIVHNNPHIRHLIGKVTIYPDYDALSRDLIYAYLDRYCRDPRRLFEPYESVEVSNEAKQWAKEVFTGNDNVENLQTLKRELRTRNSILPPMFSAYLNLTPNLRYYGTAVEATFSGVYDSGIMVNLDEVYEEKKERYIGSYEEYLKEVRSEK